VPTAVLPRRRNVYADGPADNSTPIVQRVPNPMGRPRSNRDDLATRTTSRSMSPLARDRISSISTPAVGSPDTLMPWASVGQPTASQFPSSWEMAKGPLEDGSRLGSLRVAE
jgi:hypothetical protein